MSEATSYSQRDISRERGMSRGRYSMIVQGLIDPTPVERNRLGQVFQAPASTLFRPALREHRRDEEIAADVECSGT